MDLDSFLSKLDSVKPLAGGQFSAKCPAHADNISSLNVAVGEHGNILVTCHAGCEKKTVLAAIGVVIGDLMGEPFIEAEYTYTTEDRVPLYVVERWANPKTFRCRPGLPPIAQRVLYNLPAIKWARENNRTVYVVEGEKDVDTLAARGIPATCNPGGAGKWLSHFSDSLRDMDVVVVADNDTTGVKHAREVATSISFTARSVTLAKPRYGKDISDLFAAGFGLELLDPLPMGDLGIVRGNDVVTKGVTWAWPGYIPNGKITLIEGDPGDGKSLLTVDLAAKWSSGAPMPDGVRIPGGGVPVLIVSAEDDIADTIVPRLRLAGADDKNVFLSNQGVLEDRALDLTTDAPLLAKFVIEQGVRVIIVDPITAMLGEDTDSHKDASVRRALYPLFRLARDLDVAVLGVRHLNKGSGNKAIYRGTGSIGFVALARAAYAVGRNPDDPEQRVISCVKSNLAIRPASLAYRVLGGANGAYIEWDGVIDLTVQEMHDGASHKQDDEALEFLDEVAKDGPLPWKEILKLAKDEGIDAAPRTLLRRRELSRLIKFKGEGGNRGTTWGYLEHKLAMQPPLVPSGQSATLQKRVDGEVPPESDTEESPNQSAPGLVHVFGNRTDGQVAASHPNGNLPEDEAERLEAELNSRPQVCDVCGSEDVRHFLKPWYVIRCLAHNPLTYHAEVS